jgi:hypothetical protein
MNFTSSHTMVLEALHRLHHGEYWPWPFDDNIEPRWTYTAEGELLGLAEVSPEGRLAFLFHPKAEVNRVLAELSPKIEGARWGISISGGPDGPPSSFGPLRYCRPFFLFGAPAKQKALREVPNLLWEKRDRASGSAVGFPSVFQKLYPDPQGFTDWFLEGNPLLHSAITQDKLLLWSEGGKFTSPDQHLFLHQLFQSYPERDRLFYSENPDSSTAQKLGFKLEIRGLLWFDGPH